MEMNDRENLTVNNEEKAKKSSNVFFKTVGLMFLSLALAVLTVLVINI